MDNYSTPKKMKQVGELFNRYKLLFKPPQDSVERVCVEVIKNITGFDIDKKNVSYNVSTRTISLKIPSVVKSEIWFKKKEILQQLKRELGENNYPENLI